MTPRRKRAAQVLIVLALVATIVIPVLLAGHATVSPPKQPTAPQRDCGLLSRFASEAELIEHLRKSPYPGPWVLEGGLATFGAGPDAARETAFSRTNVQVQGVDEADIVKTDGTNLYATSWGMNGTHTSIVRAHPPADAALLSRIPSEGWGAQLFVGADRLVVIAGGPSYGIALGAPWGWWEPTTSLLVYDVSDPSAPVLTKNVTVSGWYAGSRMIGDVVYLVASAFLWLGENDTIALPTIWTDGVARTLTYSDLGYFADSEGSHVATMILAVDIRSAAGPDFESFLTNGAGQLYASLDRLYLAASSWAYVGDRVVIETSTIHEIAIGAEVRYVCSVVVPGTILNQFSMDEQDGYLRVATTLGQWTPEGRETSAGVFVFDDVMNPTGQVAGLAEGERIFAVRFLGDRAYLVTYRQVDPLFVLDVSDPAAPRVLGYLKIPGVSDYLHPYGDRYLIGLGRNDPGGTGRLEGVKVSLFDVLDVEHPEEVATYVIGGGENAWAYSEALYDHHAFLFVPGPDLVAFPVVTVRWDAGYTTYDAWSGAYVLSVSPTGFALRGTVTHSTSDEYWSNEVRRCLSIGDYLYTVSNGFVVASDMDTLTEVARVSL